jgi:hypothetical protein
MRNRATWAVLFATTAFGGGCTALNDPVPDAIPVRRLPDEVLHAPAPSAARGDTTVRVNRPVPDPATAPANDVARTKYETKAEAGAPVPVPADAEVLAPVGPAPVGCGSCAVFYTGGALGSGSYPLRCDLRITDAIAVARGPLHPGFCNPTATRVTVLRRLANGQQLAIFVDLNEALRDPRENIPVWPGDMILTHETCCATTGRVLGQLFRASVRVPTCVLTAGAVP